MSSISYCRVSTKNQSINGRSLDEQAKIISIYAINNNLNIIQYISEIMSGKKNRYLSNNINNGIKNIIFADVSRFSRNVKEGLTLINKLKKKYNIHFVDENIVINKFSNEDSIEIKTFKNKLIQAENESIAIGKRIKRIKQFKADKGEHKGGIIPFGLTYKNKIITDGQGNEKIVKKYVLDERAIKIVEFITLCKNPPFTNRLITNSMRKISIYDDPIIIEDENYNNKFVTYERLTDKNIADLLNIYEVTYKNGKPFTSATVRIIRDVNELKSMVKHDDDDQHKSINNINHNINKNCNKEIDNEEYEIIKHFDKMQIDDDI